MYRVVNRKGQVLNSLVDKIERSEEFFCPSCKNPVRFRSGQHLRPHFAHVSKSNCQGAEENEGPEHLGLKALLFEWFSLDSEVGIEVAIPECGQVADLLVDGKVAIEVQCSYLSIQRLKERTRSYQVNGYRVVWLLGKKLWLGQRLTVLNRQFLRFSPYLGFYVWELDLAASVLRLRYLLHEDLKGRLQGKVRIFPLDRGGRREVKNLSQHPKIDSFKGRLVADPLAYIRRQLYYRHPYWVSKQLEAYEAGRNLLGGQAQDFYPQIRLPKLGDGFVQVEEDLPLYYEAFDQYYQSRRGEEIQVLYSPAYYLKLASS